MCGARIFFLSFWHDVCRDKVIFKKFNGFQYIYLVDSPLVLKYNDITHLYDVHNNTTFLFKEVMMDFT